jgi:formylglycine-generating enzyme required for sulfatase activity
MRKAERYHLVRGAALAVLLLILTVAGLAVRHQILEKQNQSHAEGLVQRLLVADVTRVPDILKEIDSHRIWTDPLLRVHNENAAKGSSRKLHTSLALLPVDRQQRDYLYNRLLDAEPHEVPILRDALTPHKEELRGQLWVVVEKPAQGKEKQRLRAASALATYDPENRRWEKIQDQVVNDLVGVPTVHLAVWMDSLRPVRAKLLAPLRAVFRDKERRETERSLATDVLADFAADQPEVLADLLLEADEKQLAVLYPRFQDFGEGASRLLTAEIAKGVPPDCPEEEREKLARRQANAAVALLRLGRPEAVWSLLKPHTDPRTRSYLIHRLGPMGVKRETILRRLGEEVGAAIRSALVLSLGEFDERSWAAAERKTVTEQLQLLYRTTDDPGLHGAAEWLLRHWKQDPWLQQVDQQWANDETHRKQRIERIGKALTQGAGAAKPQWYVNGQGQTLVVIPGPGKIWVGSPAGEAEREEDEQRHAVQLDRSFAIAAKPVTVEQFLRFRKDHPFDAKSAPRGDCPVNKITWYAAAAYCNWLSKQEGLPEQEWCYLPNKDGEYADGMKLAPNHLRRTGYRLPTEAEWEYACRAGTVTSRHYGESEELLKMYARYMKNSARRSWPVGSLKPNDWGLFDMHGNVWTWCQGRYQANAALPDGRIVDEAEDSLDVVETELRVLRGGSFPDAPAEVRAARRVSVHPGRSINYVGFRLARTFRQGVPVREGPEVEENPHRK